MSTTSDPRELAARLREVERYCRIYARGTYVDTITDTLAFVEAHAQAAILDADFAAEEKYGCTLAKPTKSAQPAPVAGVVETPRTNGVAKRSGRILAMLRAADLTLPEAGQEMQDNLNEMAKLERELTAALQRLAQVEAERDELKMELSKQTMRANFHMKAQDDNYERYRADRDRLAQECERLKEDAETIHLHLFDRDKRIGELHSQLTAAQTALAAEYKKNETDFVEILSLRARLGTAEQSLAALTAENTTLAEALEHASSIMATFGTTAPDVQQALTRHSDRTKEKL